MSPLARLPVTRLLYLQEHNKCYTNELLLTSLQLKPSVFWLMRQKPRPHPRGGLTSVCDHPRGKTLTCALHPHSVIWGGDSCAIPERRQALPQPTNPLPGEGKDWEVKKGSIIARS